MNRCLLLIGVLFYAAASANGQAVTGDARTEQALEAVESQFLTALERNDRRALEHLLADGFTFVHASGQLDTKAEYIAFAAAGQLGRQRAETERINEPWRIYGGNTAIRQSRAVISGLRLRNTAVYARIGERWQLVSLQSTRLPVRPPAATIDPRVYSSYVGEYQIDPRRSLLVTMQGRILMGRVPLRPEFELVPQSDSTFIRHNDNGGYGDEIVFLRDADQGVTYAALRADGREIWRAKKIR